MERTSHELDHRIVGDDMQCVEITLDPTLAAHLYGDGKLSLGQAAELAGLDKVSFIGKLADYKVSVFNSPIETIIQDMRNA